MRNSKNQHDCPTSATSKLHAFCTSHSLFKSDEEFRESFDNFFVGNHAGLVNAERGRLLNDFELLEEILPVLHELGERLVVEGGQHETKKTSQADSSNRLYASLKRHPE